MRRAIQPRPTPARGLAALTIVMVLFLIMAMVAAYTNRNLIFEQRTAANTYRAERALVAADSAVDWTLSMLNGGRIDDKCKPSAQDGDDDYRSRYLTADAEGRYSVNGAPNDIFSGCVNVGGALTCGCPSPDKPDFSVSSTSEPAGNAFRVNMARVGLVSREGMVTLDVRGCGSPGLNGENCASNVGAAQVDGIARVIVALGVVRALPVAPVAALTTAKALVAGGNELRITNIDAQTGYTVHTGQAITATGANHFVVPAGSSGTGLIEADASLAGLAPTEAQRTTENDKMFIGTFGMDAPTYRRQQAVVRKTCPAAGACGTTDLDNMLQRFPGRAFWFDGDLTIDAAAEKGVIGTASQPALVIVTGKLSVQASNPMVGLFYAGTVEWDHADATLSGAILSAGDFTAKKRTTITYDADVLKTIVNKYGTFVRVPGSWNRPTF